MQSGLLRLIRRSSALTTLDKGLEFYACQPAADNPPVCIGETGTWRFEHSVSEVKRYTAAQEQIARNVLAEVKAKGSATDAEILMQGAQACYDLCGQNLFRLLTGILNTRAKEPSETHRAIAELASRSGGARARPRHVPRMGFDSDL